MEVEVIEIDLCIEVCGVRETITHQTPVLEETGGRRGVISEGVQERPNTLPGAHNATGARPDPLPAILRGGAPLAQSGSIGGRLACTRPSICSSLAYPPLPDRHSRP